MLLNKIINFFRPTKAKLVITIPIFCGLFLVKFFLVVALFSLRDVPESLAIPLAKLVMAGINTAAAGTVLVKWLDSLFWITDGSGGIIKRPDFMLLILEFRWVFDLIWAYILACFFITNKKYIISIYAKKVNRNECVPGINKHN